MTPSTEKN